MPDVGSSGVRVVDEVGVVLVQRIVRQVLRIERTHVI